MTKGEDKLKDTLSRKYLHHLTSPADAFCHGSMSRRKFLSCCAAAGISFSSPYFLCGCSPEQDRKSSKEDESSINRQSASRQGSDQYHFLQEVGKHFTGTKLRVVSEDTPSSKATKELITKEFTPLTGITVDWELLPLDRVLAKIIADTSRKAGVHDLFYLDQAWLGDFYEHCLSPSELMGKPDFDYPGYNFEDILRPLCDHTASYNNKLIGIPFDIPVFILMYRKDIFDKLGLTVPTDLKQYLEVVRVINDAMAPEIYGTTAQWKSSHYGLHCNMTSWLWAHGGSIFAADQTPSITDEYAHEAMEYMLKIGQYMAPGVTAWDWHGEAISFAQGQAGIYLSWGEYFASYDDPSFSNIIGLAEAAPCPAPIRLRAPEDCGFGEVPGIGHQGGSCLAVSRYSSHINGAWILLQWATSADVTTRSCLMGGGSSPIRKSNYDDPRIKAKAKVTPGTTRHFDVVLDTIMNNMGTEPHLPGWAGLATKGFATELGKMTTRQQSVAATLEKMKGAAQKTVAAAL